MVRTRLLVVRSDQSISCMHHACFFSVRPYTSRAGPCSPNKPPPRGPPGGGGGSGRSGGARKHQAGLGLGVILAIVLGTLGVVGLLGWCIYRNCLSPAGKARRSPDPSNRGSDSAQEGIHMHHVCA